MLTYSDGNTSDLGVVVGQDGAKGAEGKDGADGVGISDVAVSTDGVLVITLSNGEVKTLGNIKGEKGEKGDKGDAGRGIDHMDIVNGELWVYYTDGTNQNLGKVSAETNNEILKFTRLDDGTLSVAIRDDFKDVAENISIPSYAYGRAVTQITEKGFYECKYLKNITIPNTITTIGNYAFSQTPLSNVDIPNSVTQIGAYAFEQCTSLTTVNIPNSVVQIGDHAFLGCTSLATVYIPDSVVQIDSGAFSRCTSLTDVRLSPKLAKISSSVFSQCTALERIQIPSGITEIDGSAFDSCTSLSSVNLPDTLTTIGNYAFSDCSKLKEISIPAKVSYIGRSAFETLEKAYFARTYGWKRYVERYKSGLTELVSWGDVTVTDSTKAAELLNQSYYNEGFNASWTEFGYIWKTK